MNRKEMFSMLVDSNPTFDELRKWATEECDRSMKSLDAIEAKDLSVKKVCEERGYRKGLRKIFEQANYWKAQG